METAEVIPRAAGCPKINLQVRVSYNQELSRFYQRIGFRVDEVICYGKRLGDDSP
jgi:ribosomal protein S18 acetylase RimI-like enzyme